MTNFPIDPGCEPSPEFLFEKTQSEKPLAVNQEALVLARELGGFSQSELSARTGFSQAKLSRFEDGLSVPTEEDAERLAAALGVPKKFFYRSDVRRSIFNSFYRKRKSVPQKAIMKFNAWVCVRQIQIDRLMAKVEVDALPVPQFDFDDQSHGGVEGIAQSLRQLLRIPPGPVRKLISALENAGIVVVEDDFGIPKLDGVSTFSNLRTPIIFLNKHSPPSRRKFTAAHEYAHTVLHKSLNPDVDTQADHLASEFLMPKAEILGDFTTFPLTLARLADLKLKWKVSMAALLYRAKAIGAIDQRRYSYLFMLLGQAGYRVVEPYEETIADDTPALEREMLDVFRRDLEYTDTELADVLDTTEAEISRRVSMGTPPQIRVL